MGLRAMGQASCIPTTGFEIIMRMFCLRLPLEQLSVRLIAAIVFIQCSAAAQLRAQRTASQSQRVTAEPSALPASLSRAGIERLKQATVYIKVRRGGQETTGSGFMLRREPESGFIVTNSHVVILDGVMAEQVTVVFYAGTANEKEYAAKIVATNPGSDLAVLRVAANDLPEPLPAGNSVDLYETLPVYISGFPFGESLAAQDRNPSITVSRGTVSSIRRDSFDRISTVQIDGSINPGNSGGPIVATDGRLVGIAVATLTGTQIGWAIPHRDLQAMLRGETGPAVVARIGSGQSKLKCTTVLVDPLARIKEAAAHVLAADSLEQIRPGADGRWSELPGDVQSARMPVQNAMGRLSCDLDLNADARKAKTLYFQISLTSKDGEQIWQQPCQLQTGPDKRTAVLFRGKVAYLKPAPPKVARDGTPPMRRSPPPRSAPPRSAPLEGDLPAIRMKLDRKLVPAICWSPSGEEIFTLSTDGVLTKLSISDGAKLAEVELDAQCADIERSKEGLVVVLSDLSEIRVLDEQSLEPRCTARVPGAESIACSPTSSRGYVLTGPTKITVVDLKGGRTADLEVQQSPKLQRPLRLKPHDLALTPDGKYLFAEGGIEMLVRMAVTRRTITIEESSPRIISGRRSKIVVSADSKFVAVPSGGGNSKADNHPKVSYGTYIYEVANLRSPRLAVSTGAYPQAIGFDVRANLMYGQNHDTALIVLSAGGMIKSKYSLGGRADTRVILPHPDGYGACALTESQVVFFDLSEFRK